MTKNVSIKTKFTMTVTPVGFGTYEVDVKIDTNYDKAGRFTINQHESSSVTGFKFEYSTHTSNIDNVLRNVEITYTDGTITRGDLFEDVFEMKFIFDFNRSNCNMFIDHMIYKMRHKLDSTETRSSCTNSKSEIVSRVYAFDINTISMIKDASTNKLTITYGAKLNSNIGNLKDYNQIFKISLYDAGKRQEYDNVLVYDATRLSKYSSLDFDNCPILKLLYSDNKSFIDDLYNLSIINIILNKSPQKLLSQELHDDWLSYIENGINKVETCNTTIHFITTPNGIIIADYNLDLFVKSIGHQHISIKMAIDKFIDKWNKESFGKISKYDFTI